MVTFRFLYHTMFLVCVFNVCLKISTRIRTGVVCSFNSLIILPLMLSGPQVVLILFKSFCTPGRYCGCCFYGLVHSGMLSVGSTVNTDQHCVLRNVTFLFSVSCDLSIAPLWCDTCFVRT